jgi:hypothetical protein
VGSGVYRNNAAIADKVKFTQKNYVKCKQEFYDAEEFLEDNPNFFYNLSRTQVFKYFGDFHCRLQKTCVSEAAAEREIKPGKRMVTKHSRAHTNADMVVQYILFSSRRGVKDDETKEADKKGK